MMTTNNKNNLQTTEEYTSGASGAKVQQGAMHPLYEGAQTGAQNMYAPAYEPPLGCIEYHPSCVIYENWIRSIRCLPLKQQAIVYNMIYDYSFYGILPEPNNSIEFMLFNMTIPNIKKSKERYEKSCTGGNLGGREKHEYYDQILDMYLHQEMKPKAISESLGISINTVKSIVNRHKQNGSGGCKGAKGANLNDNVNVNVNDNVNVKNAPSAVAPSLSVQDAYAASADNSASLTQQAAPGTESYEQKLNTYNDQVVVMKYFQQHKKPAEIVLLTGFSRQFINDSIDIFRKNHDCIPKPPVNHSNMIIRTDGEYFMDMDEYFNDCTNNGKNSIDEMPWDIIKENLIENKAVNPDGIITEMKQRLLKINTSKHIMENIA